jgi:hypothetical protein
MANQNQQLRYKGYNIEVTTDDDGTLTLSVDGESVPMRIVDNKFVTTYFEPQDDAITAAKRYVDRLMRK